VNREQAAQVIIEAVAECDFCISVADPTVEDVPLIAVSTGFEEMTGFCNQEICGKNCRFLNTGCSLSDGDLMRLRHASNTGAPFTALLPNRKKSGEMFVNLLALQGLALAKHPTTGEMLWFCIGIQADVTDLEEGDSETAELPHEDHVKQRGEIVRLIREKMQQGMQGAKVGAESQAANRSSPGGGGVTFELLFEPLWMTSAEGDEIFSDSNGSGDRSRGWHLKATMPPAAISVMHQPLVGTAQQSSALPESSTPGDLAVGHDVVRRARCQAFSEVYYREAGRRSSSEARWPWGQLSMLGVVPVSVAALGALAALAWLRLAASRGR